MGIGALLALFATFELAPISFGSAGAMRFEAVARLTVAAIPVAVGVYAWRGAPFVRFGGALVTSGVIWLVVTFSLADRSLAYSTGRVASWIGWAAILYLVLAFPEGRLVAPADAPREAGRSCCRYPRAQGGSMSYAFKTIDEMESIHHGAVTQTTVVIYLQRGPIRPALGDIQSPTPARTPKQIRGARVEPSS